MKARNGQFRLEPSPVIAGNFPRGFPAAKRFAFLSFLALASCATDYQPQSFTGGFSDYMTAPDEAVVTFHGNDYTSAERVVMMTFLRCADVTLEHGYRYFVGISMVDLSTHSSFTTPGHTSISDYVFENENYAMTNTTPLITPSQTLKILRPAVSMRIRMSNDEQSLEPLGGVIDRQEVRPQDAALLSHSLRQALGMEKASANPSPTPSS
jgi:hypothetical protein